MFSQDSSVITWPLNTFCTRMHSPCLSTNGRPVVISTLLSAQGHTYTDTHGTHAIHDAHFSTSNVGRLCILCPPVPAKSLWLNQGCEELRRGWHSTLELQEVAGYSNGVPSPLPMLSAKKNILNQSPMFCAKTVWKESLPVDCAVFII